MRGKLVAEIPCGANTVVSETQEVEYKNKRSANLLTVEFFRVA
jgi:hypothetical protein